MKNKAESVQKHAFFIYGVNYTDKKSFNYIYN